MTKTILFLFRDTRLVR